MGASHEGIPWGPPMEAHGGSWFQSLSPSVGDVVASWLEHSSLDGAVRVQALARDIVLCSWARHCTLTMPLSTQVYKWVPVNCWENLTNCGGVTCDGLASRPGEVEILLAASCYRSLDKLRQLWASLGSKAPLNDWCLQCDFYNGDWGERGGKLCVLRVECAYKVVVPPNQVIYKCLPGFFGTLPGLWGSQVIGYKGVNILRWPETVEFSYNYTVLGYLLRNGSLYTLKLPPIVKFRR